MPHKMNTRSCERVNGLAVIIGATCRWSGSWPATSGTRATSPARWSAGWRCRTRSSPSTGCSPTFLTVLDEFGAYPAVVARELDRYLPFLATTRVLVAAVGRGVGREDAHEAIKEHAVAVALAMREKGSQDNDLLQRLADDDRLRLSRSEVDALVADPQQFVGAASAQVNAVAAAVGEVVARHPEAGGYVPPPIL